MRITITYIIVSLLLWSCDSKPSKSIVVSVLSDKTDSIIPRPKLSHIKYFFENPKYAKGKYQFWYGSVTNTSVNASYKSELLASSFIDNALKQKEDTRKFYVQIDTFLMQQNRTKDRFNNSSILKPLVRHLSQIKKLNTSDKVVLMYSDILEASDILNIYTSKGYFDLLNHPEKVLERFRSEVIIPDLSGIELYIIYYPKDMKTNRLFEQMQLIYRELFDGSGLIIHIGIANPINS